MRWSRSLGAQVWLMVLLCATAVLGLVVVNARAEIQRVRSDVSHDLARQGEQEARSDAQSTAPGGDTEHTLSGLAQQPQIAEGGARCATAIAPLQKAVATGSIVLLDSRGVVLCSAAKDLRVGDAHLAGATPLLRMVAAGRAGTDGPFRDSASGTLTMFTAVPVPGHAGTAVVYLSDSQSFFAPVDEPAGTRSLVVDQRTGALAMHYPPRPQALGTDVRRTPLSRALRSRKVVGAVGLDGVRGLYRSFPVAGTPYTLLQGVSEAASYAPARASRRRNLVIATGLVVVLAAMGLLLQRRVARPARALRRAIRALAKDAEADPAPTDGPSELADVAHAFNDMADARRRADGLSRAILQHASDLLLVVGTDGRLAFAAPEAQAVLGVTEGQDAAVLARRLHVDDRERVLAQVTEWLAETGADLRLETRVHDADGATRTFDVRVQDLRHDRYVDGLVLTAHDVTERKAFEQHLSYQARHDPLTGLANRAAVLERLGELLEPSLDQPVCVLFLDLDRFKLVNDSHGHGVGDRVLVALGRTLTRVVPPGSTVARFGGDEFVVVAPAVTTTAGAEDLAARLRGCLEEPVEVGRGELFVSGSVGITVALPGDAPEQVLRDADTAMYRAKARGRNCSALFDAAMRADAQRLLRTESDLHRALDRDQLVLHYQPVVDLTDGRVTGVEALVRWHHPERGLVPPADFIPVAEETGLVVPIGAWVLHEACGWAARSCAQLGRPLSVAVNVSPRQLSQPGFLEQVDAALRTSRLAPELLTLEVTETVLMQDADVAERVLTALHERGVRIAIDDFGTGWSSLTYLQRFPVDAIKLDRSYVSRVVDDPTSRTIVGSLIGMARAMGLAVVAEGVEAAEQAHFLAAQRCGSAQGFHFARPLPGGELVRLLGTDDGALPALALRAG